MKGLGLHGLSRNIGATFARQVFAALVNLITVVLIARAYGPSGNGVYAVALLLPSTLSNFLNMGVGPANVYHLGSNQVTVPELLGVNLRIFIWLGSIGVAVGSVVLLGKAEDLFPGVPLSILWFALAIFPFTLLNSYLQSIFQGLQQFAIFNRIAVLQPVILVSIVTVLAILDNSQFEFLVCAQLLSHSIVLVFILRKLTPYLNSFQYRGELVSNTLTYGWKAHLSNILTFVNYKVDVFLINFFMGPGAVGVYVIAVAMGEKLWLMSQAVSTVVLPRLSQLSSNESKRKALTPMLARFVMLVTSIAALALAVIAHWVIQPIFGIAYSSAVLPLLILLPGIVAVAVSRVLANDIAARGHPEWNMYSSLVVVVVNLIGNILLIPKYGLAGGAFATTIAYSLNLILRLIIYGRFSGNRWIDSVFVRVSDLKMIRMFVLAR